MAPVIPALLPLAEQTGATPSEVLAAFIVGFEVCSRLSRANPTHNGIGSLARHLDHRRDQRGGGLRAADEDAGLGDPRRDRHRGVDRVRRQRQLRHHDQAAARRPRRAKRHDGGDARQVGLHREPLGAGGPRRLLRHASRAAWTGAPSRSTISARATIWSRWASGRSAIRAAASSTPASTPRFQIRDELGPKVADITAIKAGISKYAASRAGEQYPANMEAAKFNLQYVVAAVAGARRAEACDLRAGRDQGRARQGAGRHGLGRDRSGVRRREWRAIIRRGSR